MEKLIALIERGKPFFNAIARNKYLKAIRDGFISVMPIIIVSSIFLLVSAVPNVWGFYWPAEINDVLMKAYNYSMGIVGICAAATTAKHFCDAQNRDLPKNNQINFISVMIASLIGFLLLSSDAISFTDNGVSISGLANGYMGSKGLLTAFICAFATGIIYKFFIKRNITIKMPEQVPPNISQTFKDIIPFGVCLVFFWGFDFAFRNIFGFCFAQGVIQVFQPLFSAADGYLGLAIIYGAMSLFWFVGVHGPSIIEPAISAALISNLELNMAMYQAGEHATAVLTKPLQDFVVAMGGTGATLVICFMFAFLAKSKEMRAVGRASAVPVCFGVNEPFLFGAPMVLNPIFFIPFIFAPIANIWITKFFIDVLGMNGFMFSLPWTTPAPLGIAMGLGLQPLAFLLIPVLLIVDFLIYFPFFKVYDREKCAEEAEADQAEVAQRAAQKQAAMNAAFQGKADTASVATGAVAQAAASMAAEKKRAAGQSMDENSTSNTTPAVSPAASDDAAASASSSTTDAAGDPYAALNGRRVLVLCQGGGTSGLLANALAKAAREHGIDLETAADAYGSHLDIMPDFDLVILAPQAASYFDDLKADGERMGVACCVTRGKQYIDLTRDGEASLAFVAQQLGI